MIDHIFSLTCLRVIIDEKSKLASFIDTIHSIRINKSQSLILPPFVIFSRWSRSENIDEKFSFEVQISSKGPSSKNKKILETIDCHMLPKRIGLGITLEIREFKLSEPGLWTFHLSWRTGQSKWKEVAKLPIDVILKD